MKNQNSKGLTCPNGYCKTTIPFSYETLLMANSVNCPKCGLELNMKVPEELKPHIKNILEAQSEVEKAREFKR